VTHLFSSFLKGNMAVEGALVDAAADTSLQLAILTAMVFLATSLTNMFRVWCCSQQQTQAWPTQATYMHGRAPPTTE